MKCKHVSLKKNKDQSFYIYELIDKESIWLCPDCNMILAGEIMKQLATEVFLDTKRFDKINLKQVEDDRTKRRKGKTRRKKSRRKKSKD